MPMVWRDGIYACRADGRAIILDLLTGRYGALSPRAAEAAQRALEIDELDASDRAAVAVLIEDGVLVPSVADRAALASLPMPAGQLDLGSEVFTGRRDLLVAVAAQVVARMALRVLGLGRLHAALAAMPPPERDARGRTEADGLVARMSVALRRSESFFPRHERCLERTMAFRLIAAWRRLDVRLVVGVRGSPFAAHCWAERDGVVLNDELDEVLAFTPILAV